MPLDLESRLRLVLRLVPERHRADAEQEAALAMLESRCPIAAIDRWRKRERRHELREVTLTDLHARAEQRRGERDEHDGTEPG